MQPLSVRDIVLAAVIAALFVIVVLALWYYAFIFSVEQAQSFRRAQSEAADTALRSKYCAGGAPYRDEAVRRFCTGR